MGRSVDLIAQLVNISPAPSFDSRTVQPVTCCHTDYIIPVQLLYDVAFCLRQICSWIWKENKAIIFKVEQVFSHFLTIEYKSYDARIIYFNFSTPCISNVNNTGTKYVRIMKQTAFLRGKNGKYIQCLKCSVHVFVE